MCGLANDEGKFNKRPDSSSTWIRLAGQRHGSGHRGFASNFPDDFSPSIDQDNLDRLGGIASFHSRALPPMTLPWNEMVGTEFEKIGHVSELDRAGQFTRWVKNHDILVFRSNGTVRAFSNVCPHVGGPVGYHKMRDGLFTCLWHNLQFRASDGQCLTLKHRLREYRLKVEDGTIFVQLVENDAA